MTNSTSKNGMMGLTAHGFKIIGALLVLLLSLGIYVWQGLAGQVDKNKESISEHHDILVKMEARREADEKYQKEQRRMMEEVLRRLPSARHRGEGGSHVDP